MTPEFRAWIKTGMSSYDKVEPKTIQELIHSKKSTFSLRQLYELCTFEQYTGLKDVKGNKIFEGDILKVTADDETYYFAPVTWQISCGYPAFDLDQRFIPRAWNYDSNVLSTINEVGVESMEVVGNIHENPELLETGQ